MTWPPPDPATRWCGFSPPTLARMSLGARRRLLLVRGHRGHPSLPPPPDPATRWPCNEHPAILALCTLPVQRAHILRARRHRGFV